ncbi:hypothetical protein [Syntrophomonas wolfei]|nr:hypothetical protein [Syntrophomonas wolfei]
MPLFSFWLFLLYGDNIQLVNKAEDGGRISEDGRRKTKADSKKGR